MPPKIKKGRKKKKQQKIVIDDIDTTTLNRSNLEEYCQNVSRELSEEKNYGEFLKLDRDKLVSIIAISREHLNIVRGRNREAENDIRNVEDNHRIIMMHNRQKVIHLRNDLDKSCSDHKISTNKVIRDQRESYGDVGNEIILDLNELKRQQTHAKNKFHRIKIYLEKQHAENIHRIREHNKNAHISSETRREKVVRDQTTQLQNKLSKSYTSLMRLKEKYYQMLLEENSRVTIHLKYYYNRIVNQNKEVIQLLKDEIKNARDSSDKRHRQYLKLKEENQKLSENLCNLDQEKDDLLKQLSFAKHDKQLLKTTKEKLQTKKRLLQDLEIENYVQGMIDENRDITRKQEDILSSKALYNSVTKMQSIIHVFQLFVLHMFNRISELNSHLSEIKGIYEKEGKENAILKSVKEYNDSTLDSINYEMSETAEKRNDLIRKYRNILKKYHIQFENTGFKLLRFEEILAQTDNPRMLVNEDYMITDPKLTEHIFKL